MYQIYRYTDFCTTVYFADPNPLIVEQHYTLNIVLQVFRKLALLCEKLFQPMLGESSFKNILWNRTWQNY